MKQILPVSNHPLCNMKHPIMSAIAADLRTENLDRLLPTGSYYRFVTRIARAQVAVGERHTNNQMALHRSVEHRLTAIAKGDY